MIEGKDATVGIVHSSWLEAHALRMVDRCRSELAQYGFNARVIPVPGAMTLAYGVRRLAAAHPACRAFAAFAVMVRGETSHADDVTAAALHSLSQAMTDLDRPIICELVVVDSMAHLEDRCGDNDKNRGLNAARDLKALLDLSP